MTDEAMKGFAGLLEHSRGQLGLGGVGPPKDGLRTRLVRYRLMGYSIMRLAELFGVEKYRVVMMLRDEGLA